MLALAEVTCTALVDTSRWERVAQSALTHTRLAPDADTSREGHTEAMLGHAQAMLVLCAGTLVRLDRQAVGSPVRHARTFKIGL